MSYLCGDSSARPAKSCDKLRHLMGAIGNQKSNDLHDEEW